MPLKSQARVSFIHKLTELDELVRPSIWPAGDFIVRIPDRGYNTALPDGAWRSPASALAWGARGPGFNSRRPDWRPLTCHLMDASGQCLKGQALLTNNANRSHCSAFLSLFSGKERQSANFMGSPQMERRESEMVLIFLSPRKRFKIVRSIRVRAISVGRYIGRPIPGRLPLQFARYGGNKPTHS